MSTSTNNELDHKEERFGIFYQDEVNDLVFFKTFVQTGGEPSVEWTKYAYDAYYTPSQKTINAIRGLINQHSNTHFGLCHIDIGHFIDDYKDVDEAANQLCNV